MSQLGRTAAGIAVWTLRLLTVAAVLLAVITVVWLRRTPGPTPVAATALATGPAADKPPSAVPEPARPSPAPPAPGTRPLPENPQLTGPTRFVRRLEAGELLRDLSADDDDPTRATRRLLDLLPAMLRADGYRPASRLTRDELAWALQLLTVPPRDLRRVRLFRRFTDDPLGTRELVRVWTLGEGCTKGELEHAAELLRRVAAVAQVSLPAGVDVLMTPEMGRDVFPRQPGHSWSLGAYFLRDRYCAVASRLSPRVREEVLKHELIHAYCRQFTKDFTSSRFVSEGLAEYLRCCRSFDHGFHVPVACFAGNLARLQRMLEESGFPLVRVPPMLLVRLPPRGFYALQSLGYLLAQATMAYVGGAVIERAFLDRRDEAIVEAVATVRWRDFLRFVAENADAQATELTVEDVPPDLDPTWDDPERALRHALISLRVSAAIDSATLLAHPELLVETEQIHAVLRALLAPGEAPVFYTDVSKAMDREIVLAELPEALRLFHPLREATPRGFVAELYALLRRHRPAASEPQLVALTTERVEDPLDQVTPYSPAPFFRARRPGASESRAILCIASGTLSERDEKALARMSPRRQFALPSVLLVIDLSENGGDALPLARYLNRGSPPGSRMAYWNPQRR